MLMPRSPLVYREYAVKGGQPMTSVIALHDAGMDARQLVTLCAAAESRCRIVVPEGDIPAVNGSGPGPAWFETDSDGRPDPESYARAVAGVELFARDAMERRLPGEFRPLILGYGQGASLALSLAHILAETLTGVAAISGALGPLVGTPIKDLTGLPLLLVHDPEDPRISGPRIRSTLGALKERGGATDLVEVEGVAADPHKAVVALRAWTEETLASTFRTDFNWEIGL